MSERFLLHGRCRVDGPRSSESGPIEVICPSESVTLCMMFAALADGVFHVFSSESETCLVSRLQHFCYHHGPDGLYVHGSLMVVEDHM